MINWVGGLLNTYAAAWHVQWERQALVGKFPTSQTTYQNNLKLMFEDKEARDEASGEQVKIQYHGDIRDIFTKMQMHNGKAQLVGAGLKKVILDCLPVEVLEQMHTVDLTGKSDQEMIEIISKSGRTAEKWEEAKKNLSMRTPRHFEITWENPKHKFRVQMNFQQKEMIPFKEKKFFNQGDKSQTKSFTRQTERVPQHELTERTNAKECMSCAWPADRKESHKAIHCYRAVKTDAGSASFPEPKEYQKVKIGASDLEEDQQDLYMDESSSKELWETAQE